ncbi:hypothetical protein [Vibrio sp. 10N.286.49.B3]|uniref:hypothetical protein n=1 Tax=Vibrio sp. 10N.286.49.B3 TaxID=1880855 RepID=UPI001F5352ED|nr:hypothetical protein [Vibrio sp. 10N.286.49.B3]
MSKDLFCSVMSSIMMLLCCLISLPVFSEVRELPEEIDIFEQYGIPKNLPKLGLSTLSQGDHLVEYVNKKVTIDGKTNTDSFFLVQSTDKKGNIDLRIKYFDEDISGGKDQPGLVEVDGGLDSIENLTKIEYKLRQYAQSYDTSSVSVRDIDEKTAIVSFNYSKYALPQDIAYFRFMHVEIKVVDGQPKSMIMTNSQPFSYGKYNIEQYRQEITLDYLEDGRIIVNEKSIIGVGTYKQKPVTLRVTMSPVAFYDDALGTIVKDVEKLQYVSDPRIREKELQVDRTFPLMGDLVRRQGIDLPLPYGISVAYRNQDMDIDFESFNLGLGSLGKVDLNKDFDPTKSFATVSAESFTLRGDVYILPFWNVYALLGKIKVVANVDAEYTAETMNEIRDSLNSQVPGLGTGICNTLADNGLPFCDRGRLNVPLSLDYDVAGIGTTLSVGYREFFASLNISMTKTRLDGQDDFGDSLIVAQPMVGYQLVDYRAQILVGAEYQGLSSKMKGNLGYVEELGGDFEYDIGVDINQWAYLVGFNKQIGRHYNITALYNKGETREAFTVNLGYRF